MKTSAEIYYARRTNGLLPILALAACLLGGCTAIAPAGHTIPVVAARTAISPLDYYEWAITAPENELVVELYALDLTLSTPDPAIAAVRKSTILSASTLADARSRSQAVELLKQTAALEEIDDSTRAYKIFAQILLSIQQQREDLRAADNLNQRALQEIDTLKSRNSELQKQIQELTSIERQIIERERLNSPDP